jgi:hypothetical protein
MRCGDQRLKAELFEVGSDLFFDSRCADDERLRRDDAGHVRSADLILGDGIELNVIAKYRIREAAAQQILRGRGLEKPPSASGIKSGHKAKLLAPGGLVDEAITFSREKGQMLAAATCRLERAGELEIGLGFAEFSHFSFAIRVASKPAFTCDLASSKETHGCASRKARIWSGSVVMGKEYGLPSTLGKVEGSG